MGFSVGYYYNHPQNWLALIGMAVQSKGMRLDSPQLVKQHAANMYQQVVVSKIMPMCNTTQISEAARQLVKPWFEPGARLD